MSGEALPHTNPAAASRPAGLNYDEMSLRELSAHIGRLDWGATELFRLISAECLHDFGFSWETSARMAMQDLADRGLIGGGK